MPADGSARRVHVSGYCTTFSRQMRVLLEKGFIVMIRHPILLTLMLLFPVIFIIILSGPSIAKHTLVDEYPLTRITGLDVRGRDIMFYPDNLDTRAFAEYLAMLHDPPLPISKFKGFASEEAAKEEFLKTGNTKYAAAFTFNVADRTINKLKITYGWRTDGYYELSTSNPSVTEFYDPYRCERLAQAATLFYILENIFQMRLIALSKSTDPLQSALSLIASGNVVVNNQMGIQWFPDFEWYSADNDYINSVGTQAGLLLSLSAIFIIYYFLFQVMSEKESKLRQSLHTIGMLDSTYWLSTIVTTFSVCFGAGFLCTIAGLITQADYWLNSPFIINWVVITMFYFSTCAFAYLVSSFMSRSSSVSFVVFFLVIVLMLLGAMHSSPSFLFPENGQFSIIHLFAPVHAYQAIYLMSLLSTTTIVQYMPKPPVGFKYSDTASFTGICLAGQCLETKYDTGHTVLYHILVMMGLSAAYIILAAYFDLLFPYAHGSRLSFWTPFTLEFWGCIKTPAPPDSHRPGYTPPPFHDDWDEDVRNEQRAVLAPIDSPEYASVAASPILIYDMGVIYGGCCHKENTCSQAFGCNTKCAVENLSLSIPSDTVYGLLGPNGAGKSTTLSVLTGTLKPTSGYVTIEGYSIVHQRAKVAQLIGYAPQFDVLWPDLTPAEHIRLICRMRGVDYTEDLAALVTARQRAAEAGLLASIDISTKYLTDAKGKSVCKCSCKKSPKKKDEEELIMTRLANVGLRDSAYYQSRSLSGGMRRRLTVAMSLIGDSRVIFLDEASTGLDPISKRKLWDAIQMAKFGRCVILTTHSMDECNALADHVGIIARGHLRCNNTPRVLKRRYGIGYRLDIEVDPKDVLRVRDELISVYCPKAILVSRAGGTLTLAVPKSEAAGDLKKLLDGIMERDYIVDWSIRQTTLEEIFLAVTSMMPGDEKLS
ncbi:ABC transporter family protein [Giardia muris]|uniref:ABC transporter family protein n=1 Tax=Giardia muris TaxID=5742 RepID=A0A4Z1ST28_GIAMU|nr:ABC transporter family protein [Giardia muris]|eukprot:TNJ28155.1 ABC transporter family protein [Giardia muris]